MTEKKGHRRAVRPPSTLRGVMPLVMGVPAPLDFAVPAARTAEDEGVPGRSKARPEGILDSVADEDNPRGWGDFEDSNDDRLLRDVPPHWQ